MELFPGLHIDPRRAAWLVHSRTLIISDLHLGYSWAQRRRGLLLPLEGDATLIADITGLIAAYSPETLVLLGDIVHASVPLQSLKNSLTHLFNEIEARCQLRLVLGNHDSGLPELLQSIGHSAPTAESILSDGWCLTHGHRFPELLTPPIESPAPLKYLIGHEHPAFELTDSFQTKHRVPCFLAGPQLVIIPAFSPWAAGVPYGPGPMLGAIANMHAVNEIIACIGPRLLKIPASTPG